MDFIKYFCCCIFDEDDKVSSDYSHIKTTYLDEIEADKITDENMDDDKDFILL